MSLGFFASSSISLLVVFEVYSCDSSIFNSGSELEEASLLKLEFSLTSAFKVFLFRRVAVFIKAEKVDCLFKIGVLNVFNV